MQFSRDAHHGAVRRPAVGEEAGADRRRPRLGRPSNPMPSARSVRGDRAAEGGGPRVGADEDRGAHRQPRQVQEGRAARARADAGRRAGAQARQGALRRADERHGAHAEARERSRARFEYRELFDAAETCASDGVLNAKHKARLAVWMLHVRVVNDVHTDDNFQFAKATKAVKALVDALTDHDRGPAATTTKTTKTTRRMKRRMKRRRGRTRTRRRGR